MKASIIGIGRTAYTKNSGVTTTHLALEASIAACDDAGISVNDIDAVVTFAMGDSARPQAVITALGLQNVGAIIDLYGGGQACMATLAQAEMLIATKRARRVLVYRALNGRSGVRLGGSSAEDRFSRGSGESQYTYPAGWITYAQYVAMVARRHMVKYGTTPEALAEVAISSRANAVRNPRAVMRTPMTTDDYFNSRKIVDPFRMFDLCLETDGACAFVLTSESEARDAKQPGISVLAAEQSSIARPGLEAAPFAAPEIAESYGPKLAARLFGRAGIERADIDVASIYDCFTFSVLSQLEGLGFCGEGESDAFVREGNIRSDGSLPVNTHGGMLSEAYVHGFNGLYEVVSQLRHDAGDRQIPNAKVGLVTGFGTTMGCAAILART